MYNKGFSIGEVFRFGWSKTKQNWGFLVPYWLLTIVLYGLGSYALTKLTEGNQFSSILGQLLNVMISCLFSLGWFKSTLDIVDGNKPKFSYLVSFWRLLPKYIASSAVFFIIIVSGLALFILPGLIWLIQFSYYSFYIVDKNAGPIEALKSSSKMTRGAKWDIVGFWLTYLLLLYITMFAYGAILGGTAYLFSAIPGMPSDPESPLYIGVFAVFGLGILAIISIFVPMVSVMMAYIYRKLDRVTFGEQTTSIERSSEKDTL